MTPSPFSPSIPPLSLSHIDQLVFTIVAVHIGPETVFTLKKNLWKLFFSSKTKITIKYKIIAVLYV